MTKTANYNLNKPEPTDPVHLADFSENADIIDAALTGLSEQISGVGYVAGKYTGNGSYPRTISVGFQPKAVMITTNTGYTNLSGSVFGGLFTQGSPLNSYAEITSSGFKLNQNHTNSNGTVYNYIAFK